MAQHSFLSAKVKDGVKSDQVSGTVSNCRVQDGKTYALKIVVTDTNVKCYIYCTTDCRKCSDIAELLFNPEINLKEHKATSKNKLFDFSRFEAFNS